MEVEIKLRLPDAAAHHRLSTFLSPRLRRTHAQRNLFFDSAARTLAAATAALRVRLYEGGVTDARAVLALKRRPRLDAGVSRVEEIEEPLDPALALACADDPKRLGGVDSPIVRLVAAEYGVGGDAAPFVCLGGFRNTRAVYELEEEDGEGAGGLVLELDETRFDFGTNYELECETAEPDRVKEVLERLLTVAGVPYQYSRSNKFGCFMAEPIGELHKAHEQFILRMESYKRRKDKLQERIPRKAESSATSMNQVKVPGESKICKELKSNTMQKSGSSSNAASGCPPLGPAKVGMLSRGNSGANKHLSRCNSDDTVVVRFVGSALVGKSETEDACHHGLVEPTINTKEALDAINSMFLEPLEPETMLKRRSNREKPNCNQQTSAFDIFVDEDECNSNDPNMLQNNSMKQGHKKSSEQTRGFEIFVDENGPNGNNKNVGQNRNSKKTNSRETGGFEIFFDEDGPNGNDQNVGQNRNSKKANSQETGGFEIFVDEDGPNSRDHNVGQNWHSRKENMKLNQETSGFEIFVDENADAHNAMCHKNNRHPPRPLCDSSKHQDETDYQKPFVGGFAILPDDEEEQYENTDDNTNSRTVQPTHNNNTLPHPVQANSGTRYQEGSHPVSSALHEDTVIRRFVGSTIDDEPKVENACHNGLVDPTVNLREAMNDINNMFGKPLNFKGEKTKRKTNALSNGKAAPVSGFSILADDDLKENTCKASQSNSSKFGDENGLFEPTITTRDVMAEINDMFGMPLDF